MEVRELNKYDFTRFHSGADFQIYRVLGAHIVNENRRDGVRFTVWAPNAEHVSVVGDFNCWQGKNNPLIKISEYGVWSVFVEGVEELDLYKYEIQTNMNKKFLKSDPFAYYSELRPATASRVYGLDKYCENTGKYASKRSGINVYKSPILIYEVHLGSWIKNDNNEFLSYRELGDKLVPYMIEMGYTHVEIMPLSEHPYDGSWGYQSTGYYSITSRYGNPQDFMCFIDKCHKGGIGVIVDWVPGHFCKDEHGLSTFDGTPLYEYENKMRAENYGWGTLNFDFSKPEVRSFLISNAYFYFDIYHVDGLRVDAVASMLYLNYGKKDGEWAPNKYGGNENLDAVAFMKKLNEVIFRDFPNACMIAEESTSWPMVTKPTYIGGLGYNFKWNMGWMNDTLKFMEMDPIHRKWCHNLLTFSFMYTFSENFILPLSHDEVVHGKRSLLNKMPGDYWQKFAGLRLLYGYMMAHPGKKLLFMGGEIGQFIEWRYDQELDWFLLEYEMHKKLKNYVSELNYYYRNDKSMWEMDYEEAGFKWIDPNDYSHSIITFMRKSEDLSKYTIVLCNFTPVVHENYRIGVPELKDYYETFNSDSELYGGSNQRNSTNMRAQEVNWHNQPYSIEVKVPPLAVVYFKASNMEECE
jgi:1,4-alpha-glucan branching enzyme